MYINSFVGTYNWAKSLLAPLLRLLAYIFSFIFRWFFLLKSNNYFHIQAIIWSLVLTVWYEYLAPAQLSWWNNLSAPWNNSFFSTFSPVLTVFGRPGFPYCLSSKSITLTNFSKILKEKNANSLKNIIKGICEQKKLFDHVLLLTL